MSQRRAVHFMEETVISKRKILLVDDEPKPSFTRNLKLNLEETGDYEVREENTAMDALATAKEFKPDLILLDVIMPNMAGGEVVSQIEADRNLSNTPIVFLTAEVTKKEEGIIGGHPFLAKPMTLENVIQSIEENLAQ